MRTPPPGPRFPEPPAPDGRQTGNANGSGTNPRPGPDRGTRETSTVFRAAFRLARPAALLLAAVVATACTGTAGAAEPSPSPEPTPSSNPDRVVFRVDWEGGFVAPGTILGRLPQIVVFADGRVVMPGAQIEIYPGPLMPALQVRTLTPDTLARLVQLAKDKGLLVDAHYDFAGIADATTTVLTIDVDGTRSTVSAYALMEAGSASSDWADAMDDATKAGRAALRAFIDALTGVPESEFTGPGAAYEPIALRLYASPAGARPDDGSVAPGEPVAWPLADLGAGSPVGDGALGFRCQVVSGPDLATVRPVLDTANALTVFRSGGADWSLIVRPLLPGETGC
jgi:hypothetical protein